MLVMSEVQVEALMDLDELIDALAAAMAELSAGEAYAPGRVGFPETEHDGLLLAMPGYLPSPGVLIIKLVSLLPHNAGGASVHQRKLGLSQIFWRRYCFTCAM